MLMLVISMQVVSVLMPYVFNNFITIYNEVEI